MWSDSGKINFLCLFILENSVKIDLEGLRTFIIDKFEVSKEKTEFKNLICIYGLLKYKKNPALSGVLFISVFN